MSKLYKLKKWLTMDDAARYLSAVFEDELVASDVIRFALDGHLSLSVRLVNSVYAKRGRLIPIDEAEFEEAPFLFGDGTVRIYKGPEIYKEGKLTKILSLDDAVVELGGIYKLTMLGAEFLDVESKYQQLTGGCEVTEINLSGVILQGRDGHFFQLLESLEPKLQEKGSADEIVKELNKDCVLGAKNTLEHQFFPAGKLPNDSSLVLLMEDLKAFEDSINGSRSKQDRALSQRAETTYLNIIAALLDCISGKLPGTVKHPSFKNEARLIEAIEVHYRGYDGLSKSNLQRKFPDAKRSINSG